MISIASKSLAIAVVLTGVQATKRGLAWPTDVFGSAVNWIYDWGTSPNSNFNQVGNYYVMQWGSGGIQNLAAAVKSTGTSTVLGFNEPDNSGQSNLTPAAAASLWKQYIQPLKTANPNLKLISPAVTNGGAPSGIAWLDSFFSACTGCTFDGVAIHWYGGGTGDLEPFVTSAFKYNKPVYLTEFGLSWAATAAEYQSFLTPAMAWLDSQSQVANYAFFGAFYDGNPDDMFTSSGQLTALGKAYIS